MRPEKHDPAHNIPYQNIGTTDSTWLQSERSALATPWSSSLWFCVRSGSIEHKSLSFFFQPLNCSTFSNQKIRSYRPNQCTEISPPPNKGAVEVRRGCLVDALAFCLVAIPPLGRHVVTHSPKNDCWKRLSKKNEGGLFTGIHIYFIPLFFIRSVRRLTICPFWPNVPVFVSSTLRLLLITRSRSQVKQT